MAQHNEGFLELVNDAKSRVRETNVDAYKQMVTRGEKHVLIDTREDHEFAAGHVKGAVHMSKGTIERDIEKKDSGKKHDAGAVLRRRVSFGPGG
jgi:rhodanese-related sulfurtransferase